ncbi:apoptosis regulator BAX-like [Callorhinchus milii]|uniref:Apoptosis regulator BAX-like protein n=1 Tax=Callorhinchus milii TaxID=7868 RepID=V9L478_CALMI|nr:apoptosis regulator BAX-like [Callorhinchus milii]XP_042201032.1 apoptosis regulator BAX-like [Callorhinchus milii]
MQEVTETACSPAAERTEGDKAPPQDSAIQPLLEIGKVLLRDFIMERLSRSTEQFGVSLANLGPFPQDTGTAHPHLKGMSDSLRRIGDLLSNDTKLQQGIAHMSDCSKETFFKVAEEVFSDGVVNWGRVVMLFIFACILVLKALTQSIPNIIQTVISWTMEFMQRYVLQWIQNHGGWEGVMSYVSMPCWQTVCVFALGVLTAVLVVKWKSS